MTKKKLLPCPFCGKRPNVVMNSMDFQTDIHSGCGITLSKRWTSMRHRFRNRETAISAWNKRTQWIIIERKNYKYFKLRLKELKEMSETTNKL